MKKLLIYLKAYRKEACLAPIFKMLEAVFELFVPLVIKGIIDYGIAAEDRAYCPDFQKQIPPLPPPDDYI